MLEKAVDYIIMIDEIVEAESYELLWLAVVDDDDEVELLEMVHFYDETDLVDIDDDDNDTIADVRLHLLIDDDVCLIVLVLVLMLIISDDEVDELGFGGEQLNIENDANE